MSEAHDEANDEASGGQGRGPEGTVPDNEQGVGLTTGESETGFEPEEDPEAASTPDA